MGLFAGAVLASPEFLNDKISIWVALPLRIVVGKVY